MNEQERELWIKAYLIALKQDDFEPPYQIANRAVEEFRRYCQNEEQDGSIT